MTAQDHRNFDIVTEGCLAMLSMLVSQGMESDVYYYKDKWNHVNIKKYGRTAGASGKAVGLFSGHAA